jgi:hypothetical protein
MLTGVSTVLHRNKNYVKGLTNVKPAVLKEIDPDKLTQDEQDLNLKELGRMLSSSSSFLFP